MASAAEAPARPSLIRSTAVVVGMRGLDFGFSFLVSVLLANRFGASGQLDAFFLARRTSVGFADTIRKLVGQIVMPTVVSRLDRGEPLSVHGLPGRVHLFLGGFVLLTLAGAFVPSAMVTAFAPGFSGARHDLAARLLAIMMPLLPIAVVASLLVAVLQANRRFLVGETTNIVQRALLVIVLAVAIPPLGIVAGAWTMLAAGVLGLLILVVVAWPTIRRSPASLIDRGKAKTDASASLGGGVAAAILLNAYYQATALLDFAVASTVPEGGVAALEYGARLVSLLPGLVMSSLATVLYPEMIRALQVDDRARAADGLARMQQLAFFAQLPISIGTILGAELIVRMLFGHGAFGEASIALAAATTAGYAAAFTILTPLNTATSAIYADPRAPCLRDIAVIAGVGLATRAGAVLIAAPVFGVGGIAWAAALATLAPLAVAQAIARRRFPELRLRDELRGFARIILCGGVAAAGGWALLGVAPHPTGLLGEGALLAALGLLVLLLYATAALALRVPETSRVRDHLRARLGRRRA